MNQVLPQTWTQKSTRSAVPLSHTVVLPAWSLCGEASFSAVEHSDLLHTEAIHTTISFTVLLPRATTSICINELQRTLDTRLCGLTWADCGIQSFMFAINFHCLLIAWTGFVETKIGRSLSNFLLYLSDKNNLFFLWLKIWSSMKCKPNQIFMKTIFHSLTSVSPDNSMLIKSIFRTSVCQRW